MTDQDRRRAFRLLGIAPTGDKAEIRRAWRALVRTYHPDLARHDPAEASRRLADINHAFDLVMALPEGPSETKRRAEAQRRAEARARREAARSAAARQAAEAEAAEARRRDERHRAARAQAEARQRERQSERHRERHSAGRGARAAAERASKAVTRSTHDPMAAEAARAFAQAISAFSTRPRASRHDASC